jgi:predicted N-acyltransferase
MTTIRVSVPESYWDDAIQNRELHQHDFLPAHQKIGKALEANGWKRKRLVIDLTEEDILELIEECSLYSQGHYDADLEQSFKYFGGKLKEKLTMIRKES